MVSELQTAIVLSDPILSSHLLKSIPQNLRSRSILQIAMIVLPEELPSNKPTGLPPQMEINNRSAINFESHRKGGISEPLHEQVNEMQAGGRSGPFDRNHQRRNYFMFNPSSEVATGNKTIFSRLMEQEENESAKLALQAIKYLGDVGFFKTDDFI